MTEQEQKTEKEEKQEIEKKIRWADKIYMLHENEMWLNEQAKKGLILKRFDNESAYLTENNSQDIKYKIVILNPQNAEKQIKIIEHQGFTFVERYDEYYIFYIDGRYGHIHPRLNEETMEFVRKWFNKQLIKGFALSIVALLPFLIDPLMKHNQILQIILETPTIFYFAFLPVFIYSIIKGPIKYKTIIKCRKCFLEHETYIKRNKSVFLKKIDKVFWVFFIAVMALGIYLIFTNDPDKELPLSAVYNDMPFVFFEDIDQENKDEIEEDKSSNSDRYNYARTNSTFLAPKQYSANQAEYLMYTHYYELRFKGLVKPLIKELIKMDKYHINKNQYKQIEYGKFDIVYVSKDGSQKYIAVSKGKEVMLIEYYGDQPVEKILSEMAEVL